MLSFLQRDLPAMGVRTPADALRRFWTMLGHLQGKLFNASQLGLSLGGASHTTATRYLDTLVDTLMVRRLEPYLANVGKRLVKSPKVIRARQRVAACAAGSCRHRRTAGPPGSRLVVGGFRRRANRRGLARGRAHGLLSHRCGRGNRPGDRTALARVAVEIKFSSAPKPARGFWQALQDLRIERAFVVAPVPRRYALAEGVEVLPVEDVAAIVG